MEAQEENAPHVLMQREKRRLQDLITSDAQASDPLSAELLIRHLVYYSVNKCRIIVHKIKQLNLTEKVR